MSQRSCVKSYAKIQTFRWRISLAFLYSSSLFNWYGDVDWVSLHILQVFYSVLSQTGNASFKPYTALAKVDVHSEPLCTNSPLLLRMPRVENTCLSPNTVVSDLLSSSVLLTSWATTAIYCTWLILPVALRVWAWLLLVHTHPSIAPKSLLAYHAVRSNRSGVPPPTRHPHADVGFGILLLIYAHDLLRSARVLWIGKGPNLCS